jgi:hypothetical protein
MITQLSVNSPPSLKGFRLLPLLLAVVLLLSCAPARSAASDQDGAAPLPATQPARTVPKHLAYYYFAYPVRGKTVANFRQDIAEARLTGFHINWSKQGRQPPMDDSMFVFYRTHPNDAVPTDDRVPVIKVGEIPDSIFVTTHCTAAAELRYNDGQPIKVAAGIVNTRIPFAPGERQNIKLQRGQTTIREITGTPIQARPAKYNYFIASFYAGPK